MGVKPHFLFSLGCHSKQAGNERHLPPNSINRRADAIAKAQVIFIGKKAVAQRDYASVTAVALQKLKRHRGAVIEIAADAHHF